MKQGLAFDDVLLIPGYSEITSRSEINIGTVMMGVGFDIPIISSNMDYITEYAMADAMWRNGGFYSLHRFMQKERLYEIVNKLVSLENPLPMLVSLSIGVRNWSEELEKIQHISKFGGGCIDRLVVTVDVAHGHHRNVGDMVKRLKDMGIQRVIAGNVATAEGYLFLEDAGADAIKVGIGPGSVCTTREVTGAGVPQLTAILDCATVQGKAAIISDGGCKNSGDIVKALAAGADMVMLGSLLAGVDEAPGERFVAHSTGEVWAPYRGQSIFGVNASHYTPEGISGWVKAKGPLERTLSALTGGIRSGLSYVGARNLDELRSKVNFVQITQSTHIESGTRVLLKPQ